MSTGHGHVTPRADGAKARCGGPAICSECALEYARLHYKATPTPPEREPRYPTISDRPVDGMTLAALVSELNQLHNLGDAIHEVLSKAVEDEHWGPYTGDSWDHPAVKRYGLLRGAINTILRQAGVAKLI